MNRRNFLKSAAGAIAGLLALPALSTKTETLDTLTWTSGPAIGDSATIAFYYYEGGYLYKIDSVVVTPSSRAGIHKYSIHNLPKNAEWITISPITDKET